MMPKQAFGRYELDTVTEAPRIEHMQKLEKQNGNRVDAFRELIDRDIEREQHAANSHTDD